MKDSDKYVLVMTTTDSADEAKSLAHIAVEKKLAACVQSMSISSTYWWNDKIEESNEFLLLFKTTHAAAKKLRTFIETEHSYDIPEVIEIPITGGSDAYLQWISANTI
jgi:periplasmic divalent cation tolerance protein